MGDKFNKKIYTAKGFFADIGFLIRHIPRIREAFKDKNMSKPFMEKIMTVTTAVNGCIYCSWFHAKQALNSGISEEEIKNMMNLQFHADANEYELMALLYAQHYAETDRHPDPDMTKELFEHYGDKTANHIILTIRMIFFGNLSGNTWDAVLSRFKGKPAKDSNIFFELFFFLLTFIFMFPIMLVIKKDEKLKVES